MLEYLFNKGLRPEACNFIEKIFQHRYFPVKFAKFLRRSLQNTSGGCFCRSTMKYLSKTSYCQVIGEKRTKKTNNTLKTWDLNIFIYCSHKNLKSTSFPYFASTNHIHKKRSIIEGGGRLISILEVSCKKKINWSLLKRDAEKAFDALNRNVFIKVLEKPGFKINFETWIKILLKSQG